MSPDDEQEPEDGLAILRAKMDQFKMEVPMLADMYWTVYTALREKGFSEAQATYLAAAQMLSTPGSIGNS